MRKRMAAAARQPGWIGGQVLEGDEHSPPPWRIPARRIIVGTGQTRVTTGRSGTKVPR